MYLGKQYETCPADLQHSLARSYGELLPPLSAGADMLLLVLGLWIVSKLVAAALIIVLPVIRIPFTWGITNEEAEALQVAGAVHVPHTESTCSQLAPAPAIKHAEVAQFIKGKAHGRSCSFNSWNEVPDTTTPRDTACVPVALDQQVEDSNIPSDSMQTSMSIAMDLFVDNGSISQHASKDRNVQMSGHTGENTQDTALPAPPLLPGGQGPLFRPVPAKCQAIHPPPASSDTAGQGAATLRDSQVTESGDVRVSLAGWNQEPQEVPSDKVVQPTDEPPVAQAQLARPPLLHAVSSSPAAPPLFHAVPSSPAATTPTAVPRPTTGQVDNGPSLPQPFAAPPSPLLGQANGKLLPPPVLLTRPPPPPPTMSHGPASPATAAMARQANGVDHRPMLGSPPSPSLSYANGKPVQTPNKQLVASPKPPGVLAVPHTIDGQQNDIEDSSPVLGSPVPGASGQHRVSANGNHFASKPRVLVKPLDLGAVNHQQTGTQGPAAQHTGPHVLPSPQRSTPVPQLACAGSTASAVTPKVVVTPHIKAPAASPPCVANNMTLPAPPPPGQAALDVHSSPQPITPVQPSTHETPLMRRGSSASSASSDIAPPVAQQAEQTPVAARPDQQPSAAGKPSLLELPAMVRTSSTNSSQCGTAAMASPVQSPQTHQAAQATHPSQQPGPQVQPSTLEMPVMARTPSMASSQGGGVRSPAFSDSSRASWSAGGARVGYSPFHAAPPPLKIGPLGSSLSERIAVGLSSPLVQRPSQGSNQLPFVQSAGGAVSKPAAVGAVASNGLPMAASHPAGAALPANGVAVANGVTTPDSRQGSHASHSSLIELGSMNRPRALKCVVTPSAATRASIHALLPPTSPSPSVSSSVQTPRPPLPPALPSNVAMSPMFKSVKELIKQEIQDARQKAKAEILQRSPGHSCEGSPASYRSHSSSVQGSVKSRILLGSSNGGRYPISPSPITSFENRM